MTRTFARLGVSSFVIALSMTGGFNVGSAAASTQTELKPFTAFQSKIAAAKRRSGAPVVLPDRITVPFASDSQFDYRTTSTGKNATFLIRRRGDCGSLGRNCVAASFSVTREPADFALTDTFLKLPRGRRGWIEPGRCFTQSCVPTILAWSEKTDTGALLYEFSIATSAPDRDLILAAKRAILAGPR